MSTHKHVIDIFGKFELFSYVLQRQHVCQVMSVTNANGITLILKFSFSSCMPIMEI